MPAYARLVLFLALLSAASCREDAIVNTDLVIDRDSIALTIRNDVPFTAANTVDDSLITSYLFTTNGVLNSLAGLGTISTDPLFGRTDAAIYLQIAPPSGGFSFDAGGLIIDSAVLVLPYSGFSWGDTSGSTPGQIVRVHPVSGELTREGSKLYLSNEATPVSLDTVYGQRTVYRTDYTTRLTIDGAVRPPHLRIRLDTTRLLPRLRTANTFTEPADFIKSFRGLFVEADPRQVGSVLSYFSLQAGDDLYAKPGILVYYRTASDTAETLFPFAGDLGVGYTYIKRTFAGSPIYEALFPPEIRTAAALYVQAEPGAALEITIPNLGALPRTVYNSARFTLTALDTTGYLPYFPPARLQVVGLDDAGGTYTIADRLPLTSPAALAFVDGSRREVLANGTVQTQYILNFPRELQNAVEAGKPALRLRITGFPGAPGSHRVVLGGPAHGSRAPRLSIAYSQQ